MISVAWWWLLSAPLLLGLFNLLPWRAVGRWAVGRAPSVAPHGGSVRRDRCGAGPGQVVAAGVIVGIGRVCGWWPRRWGLVSLHWLKFYLRCRSREETRISTPAAICRVRVADGDRPTAYGSRMDPMSGISSSVTCLVNGTPA